MSPEMVSTPEWTETPMAGKAYRGTIQLGSVLLTLVSVVHGEDEAEWSAYFTGYVSHMGMGSITVEHAKRLALNHFSEHLCRTLKRVKAAQEALS